MALDEPLPRRNLGDGEHWGRTAESRFGRVETRVQGLGQLAGGGNRASVSQVSYLQRQADQLRLLVGRIPVTAQGSNYASNFTVPTAWTTRASVSLTVPTGKTSANITARGSVNLDWVGVPGSPGAERFHWPFPLSSVTNEYGPNPAYFDGMHKGIDFGQAGGTAIIAPGSGTVTLNSYDSERGNWVIIDHGDGLETWYYHLQSPSPLTVGSSVVKGSTYIGPVGTTGFSTGNHLHWETRVYGNHMNPRDFMNQYANSASSPTIPYDFHCRLVVGGTILQHFWSSREPNTGDSRFYVAGGRSFSVSPGQVVNVDVQLRSTIGVANPAYPASFAAISAFGVFS